MPRPIKTKMEIKKSFHGYKHKNLNSFKYSISYQTLSECKESAIKNIEEKIAQLEDTILHFRNEIESVKSMRYENTLNKGGT
jgi:flagellar biosynthesis/type III secretory pathway protein FliH